MKSAFFVLCFTITLSAWSASGTPAGFTTFFNSESCPEGWYPLPTAQGRLIASVADAADAGVTVNTPLSDQEDRSHVHGYSTVFPLPQKQVAAIDCCNNQGACNDNYPVNGDSHNGTSGLPFVQVLLCTLKADDSNPVPFGTIAYFEPSVSSCPAGFAPLAEARGRFLLAGYSETGIIASESSPLESGEDRVHNHTYTTSITTTDVSYVGVDGCCNGNPSAQGTYSIAGTTEEASTGLPYIQLLTCVSQNATFDSAMPPDALLFNEVGCPPGWNVSLESAGRFMVALPENGVPGATFGGNSLKPGFSGDVEHAHGFSGTVTTRSCGVGLASGCCGDGYSANAAYPYQGTTDSQAADMPYLSVPLCYQHGDLEALW